MSPVTHFLTGWVLANCVQLERRDRAIVSFACVAPDIDGLGIIPELLTRNSSHPLLWFTLYHHSLHTLAFSLAVAAFAFAVARQRWKTGLLALVSFHLHLFEDVLGSRGAGWISVADSISGAVFFRATAGMARTVGIKRVAERGTHNPASGHHSLAGMAERILTVGNDLDKG
jgi:hypothetical protein